MASVGIEGLKPKLTMSATFPRAVLVLVYLYHTTSAMLTFYSASACEHTQSAILLQQFVVRPSVRPSHCVKTAKNIARILSSLHSSSRCRASRGKKNPSQNYSSVWWWFFHSDTPVSQCRHEMKGTVLKPGRTAYRRAVAPIGNYCLIYNTA